MDHSQLNSSYLRERFGFEVNPRVFFPAASIIFLVLIFALIFHDNLEESMKSVQSWVADVGGWFFTMTMNLVLFFCVLLTFSPYGKIRLGGPDAKPEFSYWAWLAMLFSAGMGIGLVFYGVAEPISHFANPPVGEGGTPESARLAMRATYFHWGVHPWGIYALVGLSLAFFAYNRGLPLTLRSIFYPLLGKKIYGPLGDIVDIVAIVATLFGIATSLGTGVEQMVTGLDHLLGVGKSNTVMFILITFVTGAATLSVVMGLDGGIRRVSEGNLYLASGLLILVLILGPTIFLLQSFFQNLGAYIQNFAGTSGWSAAYEGSDQVSGWLKGWTILYWGWWISWAPFVGMFIAQVSRGRTIREFLVGVLFAPTLITFFWMSTFGNTAIYEELYGTGGISEIVSEDLSMALFALLEKYPISQITSGMAIIVLVLFFVTSSDSGSLVIDVISAGGHPDPPVIQRIFWAVLEGTIAAILLAGGGLIALQTAVVSTGLPFAAITLLMAVGLYKGLKEGKEEEIEVGLKADRVKQRPGTIETLTAPQYGRSWVVLIWDAPVDGGPVAAYRIRRRHEREDDWTDLAVTVEETAALTHKESRGTWEYQVVPMNRAGEGTSSPVVRVDYDSVSHRSTDRLPRQISSPNAKTT